MGQKPTIPADPPPPPPVPIDPTKVNGTPTIPIDVKDLIGPVEKVEPAPTPPPDSHKLADVDILRFHLLFARRELLESKLQASRLEENMLVCQAFFAHGITDPDQWEVAVDQGVVRRKPVPPAEARSEKL